MSLRSVVVSKFVPALCLLSALSVSAQQAAQTPAPAAPAAKAEPDYPDPRTVTVGIYYLIPRNVGDGVSIQGGKTAAVNGLYETLPTLGQFRQSPALEIGVPVTRTGMLYLDLGRINGEGNEVLTQATRLSGTGSASGFQFAVGDHIVSSYRLSTGRLYLDDLLFPHRFPVAKLRFKSIWAFRYMGVHTTVDSPTEDNAVNVANTSRLIQDSHIALPEFGLAMEYQVARHALFRIDGEGFAYPHKSVVAEGGATLAIRAGKVEVIGGVKYLHFKTNPQKEEYTSGTMVAPFAGLRWHF